MIQINDWEIKKFFLVIAASQVAMFTVVSLAAVGFYIPVLTQIVGFIYLTFVPGIVILRILRLHKLGVVGTILYSVGLSLTFSILLGLFVNALYPYIGIAKPISTLPLTVTITIAVAVLCILAYVRDKEFSSSFDLSVKAVLSQPVLLLILLPLLAILGAYLVNLYQNNIVLLLLIVIIALIGLMVVLGKFIPERLYPLAVATIAISLLYHRSLISMHLIGWDIHSEYYVQSLVRTDGYWNLAIPSTLNSMLSITILPGIYSCLLNMDGVWLFKIIYPLLFSLVPLGLFQIFRKQADGKTAFLSVFFFMSFPTFFTEMLSLARQQIAELFLVLLILLIVDKNITMTKRRALAIVFGFSLIISHYAVSYIYFFYILLAWVMLRVLTQVVSRQKGHTVGRASPNNALKASPGEMITWTGVALFLVMTFTWYVNIAGSSPFNAIVNVGRYIYNGITTEFFILETREIMVLTAIGVNPPQNLTIAAINYATEFFIVVGAIILIVRLREMRFTLEYVALVYISLLIIAMCIIFPYFSASLNMTRLYHLTLLVLAPCCILGGGFFSQKILTAFKLALSRLRGLGQLIGFSFSRANPAGTKPSYVMLLLMVLIPYFLINTGFIHQVSGENPSWPAAISLDDKWDYLQFNEKAEWDYPRFNEREVLSAKWVSSEVSASSRVYADRIGVLLLHGFMPRGQVALVSAETKSIPGDSYLYLRSWNVKKGEISSIVREKAQTKPPWHTRFEDHPALSDAISGKNKIYTNGGAQVYQ